MYNFEDILERRSNGSKKWNQEYIEKRFKVGYREKYYPLFIADMDYKLPDELMKPMIDLIASGDFGYFDIKESFYSSVNKWYKEKYSCDIENKWIVPSIGALSCMNLLVDKLFSKDDNILIFTPVYGPFKDIILNNHMNLKSYALPIKGEKYYIDFEELKSKIERENIKGIILCNPHNPSGRCWGEDELEELMGICKSNNVTIISDEVHGDLVLGNNKFVSLSKYLKENDNIIVVSSPNKTFNLAGLNIATFLCSNSELRNDLENEFNKRKLHVNRIGCEFLTICYENGGQWVEELKDNITENMNLVIDMLKDDGVKILTPEAGYLLWINLEGVNDTDDFVVKLANETSVLLETGSRFIKDNEGFLRINVATSKEILKEAIPKILGFYKEYKSI